MIQNRENKQPIFKGFEAYQGYFESELHSINNQSQDYQNFKAKRDKELAELYPNTPENKRYSKYLKDLTINVSLSALLTLTVLWLITL